MNKTNWGIIATGSIAAKLAEAINSNENSVLYAVASRSENKAKDFAEKFGAIKHYGSYEQLAADENVDVVYIATPMAQHYENAKMCIEKRKNVLCEKTITLNCKQLDKLIALAQKHNVFFMEAMWMKFIPAFRQAKEWVASRRIGDIKLIRADLSSFCPYNPDNPYDRFYTNSLAAVLCLILAYIR